jgi:hypothetical protein
MQNMKEIRYYWRNSSYKLQSRLCSVKHFLLFCPAVKKFEEKARRISNGCLHMNRIEFLTSTTKRIWSDISPVQCYIELRKSYWEEIHFWIFFNRLTYNFWILELSRLELLGGRCPYLCGDSHRIHCMPRHIVPCLDRGGQYCCNWRNGKRLK